MTRLGVIAYGSKPRRHSEAHGAILSAMAHAPAGVEFVVLTDLPERYRWLQDSVTIEHLQSTTLRQWRGPTQDRYRPKIEALRWLAGGAIGHVVWSIPTLTRRDLQSMLDRLDRGTFLQARARICAVGSAAARRPHAEGRDSRPELARHHAEPAVGDVERRRGRLSRSRLACSTKLPRSSIACVRNRATSRSSSSPTASYSRRADPSRKPRPGSIITGQQAVLSRAVEHDLVAMLMSGMKPAEAAARWRDYPVTGPLDGRPTGWKRVADRLAAFIGAPGRADD
jgi:hypothetical protein